MNDLLVYLCICLFSRMRALLLFVIDETTLREIPVEIESPTATVQDLVREVARCKGVNPNEIALSFQGTRLTDLHQALADTGLSNECRLSLASHPIIELKWSWGYDVVKVNGSDVLQWDTTKDITQFRWLRQMFSVYIGFYDQDGQRKKLIRYQHFNEIATSHAFMIVPIGAEQHGVDAIPEEKDVAADRDELKQVEYTKDLLVAPAQRGCMGLWYETGGSRGFYQFPVGYGLLLQYKNESRPIV